MADLPQSFLDSMKEILGEDYEAFLTGFDGQRQYGLRVNTLKMNLEESKELLISFEKSSVDFKWIFLQRRGCSSKASFL